MLSKNGIPSPGELKKVLPDEDRLAKGAIAVFECFQEIPCDLCTRVCPEQAVTMKGIHGLPQLDEDRCVGCGQCVGLCPGQAIFTVDQSYSEDFSLVRIPFEFLPMPEEGCFVCALDRSGAELGWYEVVRVSEPDAESRTRVISLKVPKPMQMEVRNIKAGGYR